MQTTGLEQHLNKRAQNFSGGLKRRLNLAIGLLNQPKVLCLDEPTVGIDPHSRNFILEAIIGLNRQGITVIYTSHYMEEVEQICDQVAIIDYGKILIAGKTGELLKNRSLAELTIQLDKPLPEDVISRLQKQFSFKKIHGAQIVISTEDPLRMIVQLGEIANSVQARIESIHYGFKNLEELFLSLTNKQLRDNLNG